MMAVENYRLKEDYERPLVEMIKRHFRRKQKQWEKSLDTRVQMVRSDNEQRRGNTLRQMSEDSFDNDNVDGTPESKTNNNNNTLDQSRDIVCCNQCQVKQEALAKNLAAATSTLEEEDGRQLVVQVNTKFFKPDDSITVRRESDNVVLLCAECTQAPCKRKCRQVRVEKTVLLPKSSERVLGSRVMTTRDGLLRLEIQYELEPTST
eukprot:GHVU01100980.1.p1 GENE.GHVU01100980.1~~GHVU01100980.1.p1  ORF type:complete len:206 (-),score=31.12 GHVU01100980.1:822-1439(-)